MLKATLITGRTMHQGMGLEYGKFSEFYKEKVAVIFIDPSDMEENEIQQGETVRIKTPYGESIVSAQKSRDGPHKGLVFMPYGPWANLISGDVTDGTGMPHFKGITCEIVKAPNEKIPDLETLLMQYLGDE